MKNILIVLSVLILILSVFLIYKSPKTISYESSIISENLKPEPKEIKLIFFGDIMLDRGVKSSVNNNFSEDYSVLFGPAKDLINKADIAFLNLEGPISDGGRKVGSIYSFRFDPKISTVLKETGFDIVSFANNHVGDYSSVAFKDTLTHLENAQILQTGAGMNYSDAKTPREIIIENTKFCFLGFSDVGPDWIKATEATAGILLASDPEFENIIKSAKLNCDILITSFHWGEEYQYFNARQEKLAKSAIDAGADIVIGHHPHVTQDIEIYKGKIIVYSLGNFIFDQYFSPETLEGMNISLVVKDKIITDASFRKTQQTRKYNIESISEPTNIDISTDQIIKIQNSIRK
ncbi:MAG TPA: CapA family protein [Candidatus Paceibacterota bacterium]|nr:CapA family protein [Candidatus Paceibacterota bacterium]